MKIAILGPGGIGSTFAFQLARAGHDVTVVARGARLAYLEREQAIVKDTGERAAVRVQGPSSPGPRGTSWWSPCSRRRSTPSYLPSRPASAPTTAAQASPGPRRGSSRARPTRSSAWYVGSGAAGPGEPRTLIDMMTAMAPEHTRALLAVRP